MVDGLKFPRINREIAIPDIIELQGKLTKIVSEFGFTDFHQVIIIGFIGLPLNDICVAQLF